jgi:hypothetical protein
MCGEWMICAVLTRCLRKLGLFCVCSLSISANAIAQRARDLPVAVRVRVEFPSSEGRVADEKGKQFLTGRISRSSTDSLWLRVSATDTLGISLRAVRTLAVSKGVNRAFGALRWAPLSGIVTFVVASLTDAGKASVLRTTVAGFVAGSITGALYAEERWRKIDF